MSKVLLTAVLIVSILFVLTPWASAQLPGVKCIKRYINGVCRDGGGCNFTDPDNIFVAGCASDCHVNHNAYNGRCRSDESCECLGHKKTVNTESTQCMDINNAKFFEDLCFEDCKCMHGAVGGGCNFYTKACECGERAETFDCPYKSSNEYFINLGAKYDSIGFRPF